MKKTLLFLSFLLMSIGLWGATTEYTFTSKSWAATPTNWTGSKDGNQFNTSQIPKGVQVCEGQSGVTVTSPKSFINVTKVEVTYSSSSKAVGTIGIKIGTNTALISQSVSKSQTEVVLTFTPSSAQSGTIVMTCNVSTNSYGINKIKITENSSTYTITYDSAGVISTQKCTTTTLPTLQTPASCSAIGWSFAGWSTKNSNINISDILTGSFTPTADILLYAIYKQGIGGSETFVFSEIASANNWTNGTAYTTVVQGDVTVNAIGGGNNGKYYVSDDTWRMYSGGKVVISAEGGVTSVLSSPICDFNITNGEASFYPTTTTKFETITVNYGNIIYNTNPQCTTIDVTSVLLDKDTITLHINDTKTLTATVLPANASNKNVTWSSLNDDIATVSDGVVTGITEGRTNVVVTTIDGSKTDTCVVIVLGDPDINIVEWNNNYIKIDIENFDGAVTAAIENKNTQLNVENTATELFFSKYFEAGGNNKMLAFYNGTKDTLNLNHYTFKLANVSGEVILGDYGNYHDSLMLPNTEILFVHYDGTNSAKDCADDIDGYQNWIEVPDNGLLHQHTNFGGRTSLALYKDGTLIDIIGMHLNEIPLAISTSKITCNSAIISGYNDSEGFYTYNGDNIKTEEAENNYFLSTNRCLLVRKNKVKDGSNAVSRNVYSEGNAQCNDTVALQFRTLAQEWMGYQIGNGNNSQALTDSTCTGLAYAGHYDYGSYYAQYSEIKTIDLLGDGILQADGTYQIPIEHLDTLSCTLLKVIVSDGSEEKEEEYKIPIFVDTPVYSNNTLFTQEGEDCQTCDVVVLDGGTLTISPDSMQNRNVTVYPGGRLIVPSGTKYKMNTLTLRRDNNELPHLLYNGTLDIKDENGFIFELRTDGQDWRWMTLPFAFNPKNIKQLNGKPITDILNHKVWVSYYDGKYRAYNRYNGWKDVAGDGVADTTFNAGAGFLFGISGDKVKKTYKFIWSPDSLAHEKADKTIGNLYAWGGTNESITENNKGWNLIGNPFMDNDTTDIIDPIRKDSLVKVYDINGNWTGGWKLSGTERGSKLRYAVLPVIDRAWTSDEAAAGGYESVVLDDYVLKPFSAFFVQLGGNESTNQAVTFKPITSILPNRIVARQQTIDEDEELFLRVKVGDRKTGMFISNKFTDKYEPGDDLESRYPIYQSIGGYKLLYSAINDSIIEHGVQVTSPQGTLYLDPKVDVNKFEYIYANYNNNWYDLKLETVEVNGNFIIQAKRKIKNTPTDIEMLMKVNNIEKFIYNNNMYIKKHNHIYNVLGNQVR